MTQLTAGQGPHGERLCVMFLQDLRELEARIRTAKLVSMGRMSAAVAHEIRNPLAAISQASALLNEDIQDPAQLRLTAMIEANTRRLARIVDDILDVSRAKPQRIAEPAPSIALDETVRQIATEWSLQAGKGNVSMVLGTRNHPVQFDVEHLRRILVNLLDNAARYAGHRDGAIQVQTETGANASEGSTLLVWSDGAPIEAAVEQHLFEPFFSSESRSSGLGLFICRQLCERHGASIGYERRSIGGEGRPGNAFLVRFASAAASTSASSAGASGTDALTQ